MDDKDSFITLDGSQPETVLGVKNPMISRPDTEKNNLSIVVQYDVRNPGRKHEPRPPTGEH